MKQYRVDILTGFSVWDIIVQRNYITCTDMQGAEIYATHIAQGRAYNILEVKK
jgi:hypothetical protein